MSVLFKIKAVSFCLSNFETNCLIAMSLHTFCLGFYVLINNNNNNIFIQKIKKLNVIKLLCSNNKLHQKIKTVPSWLYSVIFQCRMAWIRLTPNHISKKSYGKYNLTDHTLVSNIPFIMSLLLHPISGDVSL